jgi:hypothetical protein
MALTTFNSQLNDYLVAELDTNVLIGNTDVNILSIDNDAAFSQGNTYYTRHLIDDTTTWQTVTASTDMAYSAFTSDQAIAAVCRRGLYKKLGNAESEQVGMDFGKNIENVGRVFGNNFAYNIEGLLLDKVVNAAVGSSISATHLLDMSSSAYDWDYTMQAIYDAGNPGEYQAVFMHSDVASAYKIYDELDTISTSITTPIRPFKNAKFAGMKNGLYIYITDRVTKASTVYSTVAVGLNAFYLDWQKSTGITTNVFFDPKLEGGAILASYNASFACGIVGLTYSGSAPTDFRGATDVEYGTSTNWSRLTNARDNQIRVTVVKSLKS